jgi:hypothetical protein
MSLGLLVGFLLISTIGPCVIFRRRVSVWAAVGFLSMPVQLRSCSGDLLGEPGSSLLPGLLADGIAGIKREAHDSLVIGTSLEQPLECIEQRLTPGGVGLRGVDIFRKLDQRFEPGRDFQGRQLDRWQLSRIRFTGGLLIAGLINIDQVFGKIGGVVALIVMRVDDLHETGIIGDFAVIGPARGNV